MKESSLAPERQLPVGGDLRLPTPPGVIRRFWARHPRGADALIASVYFVPMAIALLSNATGNHTTTAPPLVINAVVIVAMTAALLFRRSAPWLLLALTWAGQLAGFADYGQGNTIPVLLALYALAVYRDARSVWIGFGASTVVGSLAAWINDGSTYGPWFAVATQLAIMMLAATLVGINVGNSKRYVAALLELAAQLARERDQQAQLARAAERARIAREMHDVIAHSLSVMVALADGSDAVTLKDPERARTAMRQVASTGRSSMHEMRRLLGVLTDDPAEHPEADAPAPVDLSPQPNLDQLSDLVDSFRAAGLPTRLERTGTGPANAGVQLTVYRIVQESLTNALRYADKPTRVTVRLVDRPGAVDVSVSDNALPDSPDKPHSHGSGRGLIGLRERVALYGGIFEAAPLATGGWLVHATIPVTVTTTPREASE